MKKNLMNRFLSDIFPSCSLWFFSLPFLLFALAFSGVYAQARDENGEVAGDAAAAERYFLWAERAVLEGRWPEALAALERAADFADVSSDISCLLALARSHEQKGRGAVLDALRQALETDRWNHFGPSLARLLGAEQLIALRNYSGALALLDRVPEPLPQAAPIYGFFPDGPAMLRLAALKGICGNSAGTLSETGGYSRALIGFRRAAAEALERYPRDPRPVRIFFEYARNRNPGPGDQAIMDLALRRLPLLLETDPDLAWMAVPFIRDREESRRLMASYRAGVLGPARNGNFRPNPASIAAALNLGLIGDEEAAAELFAPQEDSVDQAASRGGPVLDKALLVATGDSLQSEAGRNLFAEKLLAFSGFISADDDKDGYPESRALYRDGTIGEFTSDADQDGLAELAVSFDSGGGPRQALQVIETGRTAPPLKDEDRLKALILWENYPSVERVELEGTAYIPRPGDFHFAPIRFTELAGSENYSGLLFPVTEPQFSRLTVRALVSFSLVIERPSLEFEGALERIDLDRGIPLRSVETLNGRIVSVTEFEKGKPVLQRLDLDMDSRMETIRRFRPLENGEYLPDYKKIVEHSESDWDGNGIYETAEEYKEDGSVVYSWDMDGDGIREYSETRRNRE
ncbi:MAG: hypothetical protein LBD47_01850 [Treponema sp.]|jgi:tetratricopeptide (TPR) repeat protein|nr:hypothetical protein [Treponema sp.]